MDTPLHPCHILQDCTFMSAVNGDKLCPRNGPMMLWWWFEDDNIRKKEEKVRILSTKSTQIRITLIDYMSYVENKIIQSYSRFCRSKV